MKKSQDEYDPRKKLGLFYKHTTTQLPQIWWPRQYFSADEECIPFNGHVNFWCYNASKIDKYHIRIFKLVNYTNNYYFKFSLYVANDEQPNSEYGKTHDLVVRIVHEDLGKSYIISIDNFYLFPYLQP